MSESTSRVPSEYRVLSDVDLGRDVQIASFVNLYECTIGDETRVGAFVEVQRGVTIGSRCKISSHTFICTGVVIEDECFVGHGVMFINDAMPRATTPAGEPQREADWDLLTTTVKRGASIGSGSTILGGVEIGEGAMVGAGAVVTKDVPPHTLVAGVPATVIRRVANEREGGAQQ